MTDEIAGLNTEGTALLGLDCDAGVAQQSKVEKLVDDLIAERDSLRKLLQGRDAEIERLREAIERTLIVGCVLEEDQGPCAVSSGMQLLRAALAEGGAEGGITESNNGGDS